MITLRKIKGLHVQVNPSIYNAQISQLKVFLTKSDQ